MIDELCIIGRPGLVGGADTELFDQLKVWLRMGLKCRIIPTAEAKYPINFSHPNLVIDEIKRYSACSGKHVISYCNLDFLHDIEIIRKYAKTISWASCMCFNFKSEIEAHRKGLIDFFLYQTNHQLHNCGVNLMAVNSNYNVIPIVPYFDASNFPFVSSRPEIKYGRISRAAPDKYSKDQFVIYHLARCNYTKGIVLGWSDELNNVYCNDYHYQYFKDNKLIDFYNQNEISAQEFYKQCGIVCMSTGTFENLPRVGFEAMASGSVLVVDNRGGWTCEVEDGVTGYLCDTSYDFIINLKKLINNPELRNSMAVKAREKLEAEHSYHASASRWNKFFHLLG